MYLNTLEDYKKAIAATAETGKPLVIDFTASWCPPCKKIGPIFEAQVSKYPELVLRKVDVDKNKEAAQAAGI